MTTKSFLIQPKLTINTPGDVYEQEADAMANKVMRMANGSSQTMSSDIMRKESSANMGMPVSNSFVNNLNNSKGSGSTLPKSTKGFMENAFSTDFSNVKIHNDAKANNLSQNINAKAFTHGNDIYFGAGQYSPNSYSGKSLLAHELTHTLQQSGQIQRAPMPEPDTVTNLDNYAATTRQNIIYDGGLQIQNLSMYFQKGVVMDVRDGYNVSYVINGLDASESWLVGPLKAILLYSFYFEKSNTDDAITNQTTIQNIDMSGQQKPKVKDDDPVVYGPNARFRLTATSFDNSTINKVSTKNVQLMAEKIGNVTAAVASTEKPEDRRKRFDTTYQITNAKPISNDPLADNSDAMNDAKYDAVIEALDHLPATLLAQAKGISIHLGQSAKGPDGEAAEYISGTTATKRTITAYGDFFKATAEQRVFLMVHEFGHALDFRPNEGPGGNSKPSLSQGAAKDSFGEALKKDGGVKKGMSTYALTKSSEKEYFAEAFTMYINQPNTLKALRPNIYAYFLAKYP